MPINTQDLSARAEELLEMARNEGFNSIEQEVKNLPEGDYVAQIGYIANLLGIDVGLAFDQETPLNLIERRNS